MQIITEMTKGENLFGNYSFSARNFKEGCKMQNNKEKDYDK